MMALSAVGRLSLAVSLAIVLLVTGCSKKESAEPTPVAVQAATAQVESITEHIATDAVLAPIAEAAISPKITAPVKKFYVQRGSKVKQGQLLATLENRDLAAAVTDLCRRYTQLRYGVARANDAQASFISAVRAFHPRRTAPTDSSDGRSPAA